ncbi:hypothetical protein HanIR_Chr04g0176701 [Helianthus annuus]|nr:hypothetical protein HanIR_Chr04g0176701 [Helianthus annuus]
MGSHRHRLQTSELERSRERGAIVGVRDPPEKWPESDRVILVVCLRE